MFNFAHSKRKGPNCFLLSLKQLDSVAQGIAERLKEDRNAEVPEAHIVYTRKSKLVRSRKSGDF